MPMPWVANCFISPSSSMQQWANHTSSPTHSTSLQGALQSSSGLVKCCLPVNIRITTQRLLRTSISSALHRLFRRQTQGPRIATVWSAHLMYSPGRQP